MTYLKFNNNDSIRKHKQPTQLLLQVGLTAVQSAVVLYQQQFQPTNKAQQKDFAPSPKTVPFVSKVLESNFDFLEYTYSDSDAIAKWFSWLLYSIGTAEAIDLMKEYSNSNEEGIKNEMLYRLKKIHP